MSSLTTIAALFVFSSLAVIGVVAGLEGMTARKTLMLAAHILVGSFVAGALYVLIVRLQPPRGAWNLVWFIGIPILVSILRRPRIQSLALAVPLVFGAWMSFGLIAWTFQIPVD